MVLVGVGCLDSLLNHAFSHGLPTPITPCTAATHHTNRQQQYEYVQCYTSPVVCVRAECCVALTDGRARTSSRLCAVVVALVQYDRAANDRSIGVRQVQQYTTELVKRCGATHHSVVADVTHVLGMERARIVAAVRCIERVEAEKADRGGGKDSRDGQSNGWLSVVLGEVEWWCCVGVVWLLTECLRRWRWLICCWMQATR